MGEKGVHNVLGIHSSPNDTLKDSQDAGSHLGRLLVHTVLLSIKDDYDK